MLRQLSRNVIFGGRTKDREDDGNPASDCLRAVEFGGGGEEELFLSGSDGPGSDGSAEEVDCDGVVGGEAGADGEAGDVDGGLGK